MAARQRKTDTCAVYALFPFALVFVERDVRNRKAGLCLSVRFHTAALYRDVASIYKQLQPFNHIGGSSSASHSHDSISCPFHSCFCDRFISARYSKETQSYSALLWNMLKMLANALNDDMHTYRKKSQEWTLERKHQSALREFAEFPLKPRKLALRCRWERGGYCATRVHKHSHVFADKIGPNVSLLSLDAGQSRLSVWQERKRTNKSSGVSGSVPAHTRRRIRADVSPEGPTRTKPNTNTWRTVWRGRDWGITHWTTVTTERLLKHTTLWSQSDAASEGENQSREIKPERD